eukprot:SAG31_NODE_37110_length_307_cov_0.745192_1_plen_31_part_10
MEVGDAGVSLGGGQALVVGTPLHELVLEQQR